MESRSEDSRETTGDFPTLHTEEAEQTPHKKPIRRYGGTGVLLVAVLGIEPRALCKLGKCLPLSHILSPVVNI